VHRCKAGGGFPVASEQLEPIRLEPFNSLRGARRVCQYKENPCQGGRLPVKKRELWSSEVPGLHRCPDQSQSSTRNSKRLHPH